jgi:hypothetical protein
MEKEIQQWIDFDKMCFELVENSKDNESKRRRSQIHFSGKIIYILGDTVYKIIPPMQYAREKAFFDLCESLKINILEPCTLIYDGQLIKIISQRKLQKIDRKSIIKKDDIPNFYENQRSEIDSLLWDRLGKIKYMIFKELSEICQIYDFRLHNIGIDISNKLFIFDYEPRFAEPSKLNNFLEKHSLSIYNGNPFMFLYDYSTLFWRN